MIKLDQAMRERIGRAIDDLIPITVSYIEPGGKPHIAFYGSTHVHGDSQLALWVRNRDGALPRTLTAHPDVACIYGNIKERMYITFEGRARLAESDAESNRVFAEMHPIEQKFDAARNGIAVVIDLNRVTVLSAAAGKQVFE
jgi:hypothetical protein